MDDETAKQIAVIRKNIWRLDRHMAALTSALVDMISLIAQKGGFNKEDVGIIFDSMIHGLQDPDFSDEIVRLDQWAAKIVAMIPEIPQSPTEE